MTARAMGTVKRADEIAVTVWHAPRDSYARSVVPVAKRNVQRLALWAGWSTYETTLADGHDEAAAAAQGLTSSLVTFTRTA